MLAVHHLIVRYGSRVALQEMSFGVAPGELLCLLGVSGCGKSTLLKAIAGLSPLHSGSIRLGDRLLSDSTHITPPERRRIGLVFQDGALFAHMTAGQNVAFAMPRRGGSRSVQEWLALAGLEGLADRYPAQLSGGQAQRLALVRAMAAEPQALLLDEPFSSLDAGLRQQLRSDVRALLQQANIPAILVTHDPEEAMLLADRILLMEHGRCLQLGTAEELYYRPHSPSVVRFFSDAFEIKAAVENQLAITPFGPVPANVASPLAHVLIRPEAFRLTDAANSIPGTVLENRFTGYRRLLRVQTRSGAVVPVFTAPEDTGCRQGSDVLLAVDGRHVFSFPA